MERKRSTSDPSATSRKRQKSSDVRLSDQVAEAADRVIKLIPVIMRHIKRYPERLTECKDIVGGWRISCNLAKDTRFNWTTSDHALLDMRLPNIGPTFHWFNKTYESFSKFQKAKLSYLPAPSDFGKQWSQYQHNPHARLLCLCPPDARGLPLCTLHDVFRRYLLAVHELLPQASETAVAAMKSAAKLCMSMGRYFSSKDKGSSAVSHLREDARTFEFEECVCDILDPFTREYLLSSTTDMHSSRVNGALLMGDVLIALREVEAETGDAYMQGARSYDLAVKVLQDLENQDFLKQGAPMFLLCVIGPWLLVVGCFHDGEKVIVEPLGDICIMLEDYTNGRRNRLAQVLYALSKGINELKQLATQKVSTSCTIFPPFTPRIYTSCMLYSTSNPHTQGHLTFTNKLDPTNCNRLLFSASLSIPPSNESITVLVKLLSGHYGEDVQHLLAEQDLAPTLHACSDPKGAPKAYVMEYLQPSSWKTLFDYASLPNASTSAAYIRSSINLVLMVLQKSGKVHGDMRSVNIMVNVSETGEVILIDDVLGNMRAKIKVIDFDWAGDAGKVSYPALRNGDIADVDWPGKPAGPIEQDHDLHLVESWWPRSTFGQAYMWIL